MILTLNLIPESIKQRVRMQRLYGMLKTTLVVTALFVLVMGIFVLIGRLILQQQFTRIVNETTLITASNRKVEGEIRDLNGKVITAKKIITSTNPWAELVYEIVSILPNEVTVHSIGVTDKGQSTITGVATTRDALLAFKDSLEKSPFATDIALPITDLLKREDAPFTITFTVKLDAVTKR
ncbi:hypothetical protein COV04_02725 [Candidatus Uhrbacteria bacterium CG10_big_fil_rev_8_21_14_0_10_48_11]|uniref:Uncharacterized protein n=1 Tax=Candidatus Uhrbacteria bacterium CG10_big_fil_rev_8_21_14_0_10_48_11 TaxID=1975037 RepID=A0A2M8LEG1_9BACT|nr:MAG: hypothetical protein COV04_02725 [Candidatus Uhrbacteria bacterium CG10_big_fil_rev_8_21_14_0_10_48_11]